MLTLLLAVAPLQVVVAESLHGWVVKEVVQPRAPSNADGFFWESVHALGDPDRDGIPTLAIDGRSFVTGAGVERVTLLADGARLDDAVASTRPWSQLAVFFGSDHFGHAVLLDTPLGRRLVVSDLEAGDVAVWQLAPRVFLGHLGAGSIPIATRAAGDLDGDGFDDFVTVGGPLRVAAWSGQTQSQLWGVNLVPSAVGTGVAEGFAAGPPPDLDGDGLSDFLVAARTYSLTTGSVWEVRALSGADGSMLWSQSGAQQRSAAPYLAQGPDWTGDGVADATLCAGEALVGFDGASGAILWSTTFAALEPWLDPARIDAHTYGRPALTRRPEEPSRIDWVLPVYELVSPLPNFESSFTLFHLSAEDGRVRHRDRLPVDLMPWQTEGLRGAGGQPTFMPLGDRDRDGLLDYALESGLAIEGANGQLGSTGRYSAMVLLGPRTLFVPPHASVGSILPVSVALPGAAGLPFGLAISPSFARDGGRRVAGWRTHLGEDPLLTLTLTQMPWTGTLDAAGQGSVLLAVPPNPSLAGTRLRFQALVPESTGLGLQTSSTLGVTELSP